MKNLSICFIKEALLTIIYIVFIFGTVQAQMRVGQPTGSPDGSAALDVSGGPYSNGSQYRGLNPPKVALNQTTQAAPITNPTVGLLIYNTAKVGDVTPGFYYWEGKQWARFTTTLNTGSARPAATETAGAGQNIQAYKLSEIKSFTSIHDNFIWIDPGREGLFRYDSSDTTTPDNNGTVLVAPGNKVYKRVFSGPADVRWFGAKGNGTADDTQAITKALNSKHRTIIFQPTSTTAGIPTYYKITGLISTTGVAGLHIIANGAKIMNSDTSKASFLFQSCQDISIEGGDWGYVITPTHNGNGSQHVFQFDQSQRVMVNKIHILNSPEMGIAITNSLHVTVQNSHIEHTWRDGTYAHYSANVRYLYNNYTDIKDDAMSFHDYGLNAEKAFLISKGFAYATGLIATGNTVKNAFQGFSTVGAHNLTITHNTITNTVSAGIALMNQDATKVGGTAELTDVEVSGNDIDSVCRTTTINGFTYANTGQGSSGRSAIIVTSLGASNTIDLASAKRSRNIRIHDNIVRSSGALGLHIDLADGITLQNNELYNCVTTGATLGGYVVEVWSTANYLESGLNKIADTRVSPLHVNGVAYSGAYGTKNQWVISGGSGSDFTVTASGLTDYGVTTFVPTFFGAKVKYGTHTNPGAGGLGAIAFPHGGAGVTPVSVMVTPKSGTVADSQYIKAVTLDNVNITVVFGGSLSAGSGTWYWVAFF